MAKKKETLLQQRIRKRLEREFPRSRWFKHHGGPFSEAGIPDLVGCVEGLFFALEVKNPNDGEASEIQLEVIDEYHDAGGIAGVIRTEGEAVSLVHAALAYTGKRRRGRVLGRWIRAILRAANRKNVGGRRYHSPEAAVQSVGLWTQDEPAFYLAEILRGETPLL